MLSRRIPMQPSPCHTPRPSGPRIIVCGGGVCVLYIVVGEAELSVDGAHKDSAPAFAEFCSAVSQHT